MRILITGSAGFIGQSLKIFLANKGVEVISYDPKDDSQNSVLDLQNLKSKIKDADGVVHAAAMSQPKLTYEHPLDCVNINIGGTANVLEALRQTQGKRPWMIFISSREVFGQAKILPITEKTPRQPVTVYGMTKAAGEDLCRIFSESYGLKTRILRFVSVYSGENDKLDRVIPRFIIESAKNEPLTIRGTGEEAFDFTYIGDICQGTWGSIQEVEKSQKLHDDFILSFGEPVSLKDLAQIIIEETGSKSSIKYEQASSFSSVKCYADCRKAREILGFKPKVAIREGIKLVVQEFQEAGII